MFDFKALEVTTVIPDPFPHLIIPQFITKEGCAFINADFPKVQSPGSFPLSELKFGTQFQRFMDHLEGEQLRALMAEKFQVNLDKLPTITTVRGKAQAKDGRIHADTKTKIITILLYMNGAWEHPGGRLRLLNSPDNLEDYFTEVPPDEGTLLAFKVTPNCWHGHLPFVGERRVIQFNWVTDQGVVKRQTARHKLSAKIKRLKAWLNPSTNRRPICHD